VRTAMRVLRLADPTSGAHHVSLIRGLGLRRDGGGTVQRQMLDSFDWRVWEARAVLEHDATRTDGWLTWRRRATAMEPARILGRQRSQSTPSTIADLAPGPVTKLLAPVLDVRALLPRAVMRVEQERFSLRDDEDKTVGRAVLEHVILTGPGEMDDTDLGWCVVVTGVRGHDDAFDDLVTRLGNASGVLAWRGDVDRSLFEAAGAQPGYSSAQRVAIDPQMTTLQAFTTACSTSLDVIVTNEQGVRDDIDPEFLHDFRVAIRRTRAMISEAKGVLPDAERAVHAEAFKWLAGATSELRDLDVYLLGFDDLAAQLPVQHQADLAPLRSLLVELRQAAHAQVVATLDSQRYRELIDTWRDFLDAPEGGDGASAPVGQTARQRIWKAYRGVLEHGRRIDDDSPAEALHDLRKRAKKLRYILEANRSLFTKREMKPLVAQLKDLQDNLGTFQDCEVQAGSLRRFAELLDQRPDPTAPAVLAMGLLSNQLVERRHAARAEFHDTFARFDRRTNRKRYRRLVKHGAELAS
jgi:CHAD domain-containing protein